MRALRGTSQQRARSLSQSRDNAAGSVREEGKQAGVFVIDIYYFSLTYLFDVWTLLALLLEFYLYYILLVVLSGHVNLLDCVTGLKLC